MSLDVHRLEQSGGGRLDDGFGVGSAIDRGGGGGGLAVGEIGVGQ
jgi:hypothetical protein